MRATEKRKTILLVSDGEHDLTELKELLEQKYRVFYEEKGDRNFEDEKEKAGVISVAIICAQDAAADDYALFSWLSEDSTRAGIPLLVYLDSDDEIPYAEGCIKRGAIDVIKPPIYENLILNRVENAIRIKESATFADLERWLEVLPSNIYLKDEKGRYVFVTHYWNHLEHADDPDWTIRGKTDMEIRFDKENARRAMESDAKILKNGKGARYIINEKNGDSSEYLEIIKEPVRDEDGKIEGIVALINNVTELVQLRRQIEESSQRDDLTGVRNKKGYDKEMERVEKLLKEQGDDAEFGLAVIDMNYLKKINDTYGHEKGDVAIRRLSHLICYVFTHSPVFRIGGDEFVVLLENEDYQSYSILKDLFLNELKQYGQDSALSEWEKISAAIGVAFFDPETDKTSEDVFVRADKEMYLCKKAMHAKR